MYYKSKSLTVVRFILLSFCDNNVVYFVAECIGLIVENNQVVLDSSRAFVLSFFADKTCCFKNPVKYTH